MRDIIERLELQAFVADKIQSGMKPLIMDCLEEITHLRCQYEALLNQAEMNARLLTENASLRAENVQLLLELDMQQATILVPSQKDDRNTIERLNSALVEALDEAAQLRRAMHEIYEVYAGIDGYLFDESKAYREQKFKEMADIAAEHKKAP